LSILSRRNILKKTGEGLLAASGILGLGILARFLGYQTEPPAQTEFDLGPAADYPQGSRTNLPNVPALLVHTETGFTALSLVCTHLGCTLEPQPDGFNCPCHGSHFGTDGSVLRGPATRHLVGLQVTQDDQGHIILSTDVQDQGAG
jgi:cytochrome b6-f complex iron-sulfur subunit